MKTLLMITGVALFIIGIQDVIRLLADNNTSSLFGWVPGEFTLHIAIGVAVAIAGAMLAGYASGKRKA